MFRPQVTILSKYGTMAVPIINYATFLKSLFEVGKSNNTDTNLRQHLLEKVLNKKALEECLLEATFENETLEAYLLGEYTRNKSFEECLENLHERGFINRLPDEDEVYVKKTSETYMRLFAPTIIWHIDTREYTVQVSERVQFGRRWIIGILSGVSLVVIGEISRWLSLLSATTTIAVSIFGFGLLTALYAVVARCHLNQSLGESVFDVDTRESQLTGSGLIALCCFIIVFTMTNVVSILSIGVLLYVILISVRRGNQAFQSLLDQITELSPRVPQIPGRHSVYSIFGAIGLWGYDASVIALGIPHPSLVLVTGGVCSIIVAILLWRISSRKQALIHAFFAAALSGAWILFLTTELSLGSQITSPHLTQAMGPQAIVIALGLTLLWAGVWWVGIVNPEHIHREFATQGRQMSTYTAAIFAYLVIMGSGLLVLSALVHIFVIRRLLATGMTLWFGLVTVAATLPLLYFTTGCLYQLIQTTRLTYRFHRHASSISPDRLPTDSDYPIQRIPSEVLRTSSSKRSETNNECDSGVLFAAAYADPFKQAIIFSQHTLSRLCDEELSAVIAHEESHMNYRGAYLQFWFAIIPAGALIGKNVVYSIYDFYRRELTADQYAYTQLASEINSSQSLSHPMQSAIDTFDSEETLFAEDTTLGFLPTMFSVPERCVVESWFEQWFRLFYGNFAGGVHPDPARRRNVLDNSEDISLDTESDPEERVRLILTEMKEEENHR